MYSRIDHTRYPIGRRIIQKLAGGRMRLDPAIIPDLVAWFRLIGNRYIAMLEGIEAKSRTRGDAYINSVRHNVEHRIAYIQDMINSTNDQFGFNAYAIALNSTMDELGLTSYDADPTLFDDNPLQEEGSGI